MLAVGSARIYEVAHVLRFYVLSGCCSGLSATFNRRLHLGWVILGRGRIMLRRHVLSLIRPSFKSGAEKTGSVLSNERGRRQKDPVQTRGHKEQLHSNS